MKESAKVRKSGDDGNGCCGERVGGVAAGAWRGVRRAGDLSFKVM